MSSGEPSTAATGPPATVPLSTVFCADDADVVIRAAGTLDFRAHKPNLSLVSPIFKDMFTIPQSPTDTPNTLPHIDVDESAKTWENILRTIYPMPNPVIDDLDDLESLLLAAKKYDMQFISDTHKNSFENRAFIQQDPLRLYAIACSCGLDDQAKQVARKTDLLTIIKRSQGNDPEGVTMASYRRLITFLVERDNELRPTLERGLNLRCGCPRGELSKETEAKLRASYTQMEEVYLGVLEDRSYNDQGGCGGRECMLRAAGIRVTLKRIFEERERVCDKFMWE